MNREEYRIMYELEDTHWWFVGLRKIYFNLLNKFYKTPDKLLILDAGCGTGIILGHLKRYGLPLGVDISKDAISFSHLRGHNKILCASITDLPFADNSFDFISALTVICQLQVKDDLQALREFYRVLKEGGRIILHVPAYDFLRNEHDKAVHTRHRYTKGELKLKMEDVGFKIRKITYINMFLFPLIALLRLMKRLNRPKGPSRSDLKPTPALINKGLIFILTMEARLIEIIDFPFGLSILCIARK